MSEQVWRKYDSQMEQNWRANKPRVVESRWEVAHCLWTGPTMALPQDGRKEGASNPKPSQHTGKVVPVPWVKKVIIGGSEIYTLSTQLPFAAGIFP